MAKIHYLQGDATLPRGAGHKVIAHVCNDVGAWGKGFFGDVSRRWSGPETSYRAWHLGSRTNDFRLGAIQLVQVGSFTHVANMVAQRDIRPSADGPPIRYDALHLCLGKLAFLARDLGASIHMPRIATGVAGGRWEGVEPLIAQTLVAAGLDVYVYDYPQATRRLSAATLQKPAAATLGLLG